MKKQSSYQRLRTAHDRMVDAAVEARSQYQDTMLYLEKALKGDDKLLRRRVALLVKKWNAKLEKEVPF